ncbi:hypothetical protein GCM10022240_13470 [Microbacterium kribbense]|uniref:YbaB/EbfC DNA-binding family protein n=1 Tax=Microbacterium kribbense TaxID=433645 RepID=A0ABP7GED7_9MICO
MGEVTITVRGEHGVLRATEEAVARITVSAEGPERREVVAQAVQVAVERATASAQALGLAEVMPVEVADLGLLALECTLQGDVQAAHLQAHLDEFVSRFNRRTV